MRAFFMIVILFVGSNALAGKWAKLPAIPDKEGFAGAFAGVSHGSLIVAGGANFPDKKPWDGGKKIWWKCEKIERRYLKDAYRYDPEKGWKRIADLPYSVVAAPSPAPADASRFYLLGGDDGSQVGVVPDKHRGFKKEALCYDLKTEKWAKAGKLSAPRVTVPCVLWGKSWVVPSGEMRPGVRSSEVWAFTPGKKD